MIKKLKPVLFSVIFLLAIGCNNEEKNDVEKGSADGALSFRMYNPEIDNPEKEWSYYPKPTTVIGVPFSPKPVQVTFDGTIFTGDAELCFFYGNQLQPIMINQRHFHKGWIPIVEDEWMENDINYTIELFGTQLDDEDSQNSIQFVKVSLQNKSAENKTVQFAAAITASGIDHRQGNSREHINSEFHFEGNSFFRDGKLLYSCSEGAEQYAVQNQKYQSKYKGADFNLEKNSPTGIFVFKKELASGESTSLFFKIPRTPIDKINNQDFTGKYFRATHEDYRARTIQFLNL